MVNKRVQSLCAHEELQHGMAQRNAADAQGNIGFTGKVTEPAAPLRSDDQNCEAQFLCAAVLLAVILGTVSVVTVVVGLLHETVEDTTEPTPNITSYTFTTTTSTSPGFTPNVTGRVLPWFQIVDAADPRYTDQHHRFLCVFHADADGLTAPNGVRFGIEAFPFALCHVALLCCPSLTANLEPGEDYPDDLMEDFVSRARTNQFLKTQLMLGDSSRATDLAQFQTLLDDIEADTLDNEVGAWYKLRNYTGIVFRWPESTSSDMWQRMPRLLRLLGNRLMTQHNLSLGLALRQDTVGAAFSILAAGNFSPSSIYVLPPRLSTSNYTGFTFSYFSDQTLAEIWQLYTQASSSGLGNSVCYLLPAETYTFRVAQNESPRVSTQVQSLGPGIQGSVTSQPGKMAQFETCTLVQTYERLERSYDVLAALNESWLSYTSHALLRHFLDALHENVSAQCMGIWNPHWDDFANVCGEERAYPLARAIFWKYNDSHP